jgi:hypothetical protein
MFNEVKIIVYKNVKKQGKNCYVAAILMDLSKAFDCLRHDILLSKLAAYGLSSQSVLENYLTGHKQQIKEVSVVWSDIHGPF